MLFNLNRTWKCVTPSLKHSYFRLFSMTYKGIQVAGFGGSDVLKVVPNIPLPVPKDNEVLVQVKFSGVNPVDTYIRQGAFAIMPPLPYTPGKDGAGIVKKVGVQVKNFKEGDRVFVCQSGKYGTLAEYSCVAEKYVFKLDQRLGFDEGACIGVPYFTAYRSLYILAKGKPGMRVLVHGASGGVGQAAVQLAAGGGMQVTGTAGTTAGINYVKKCGAEKVYCHREKGYLKTMEQEEEGFDIIVEMLSNVNLGHDLAILRPRGIVVVVGCRGNITISPRLMMKPETSIIGCALMSGTQEEWVETGRAIQTAIRKGIVKPHVSKIYSLEEASKAHDDIMSGDPTLGKLVVNISG